MGRLSVAMVRALTTPGRYGDGDTLYLNVAPGGSKSWVQRVVIEGKRRDIGLGGWPVVSLAKARRRAFAGRVAIDAYPWVGPGLPARSVRRLACACANLAAFAQRLVGHVSCRRRSAGAKRPRPQSRVPTIGRTFSQP